VYSINRFTYVSNIGWVSPKARVVHRNMFTVQYINIQVFISLFISILIVILNKLIDHRKYQRFRIKYSLSTY